MQSKWVAEQVIELGRSRGLPVSVYRVDVVCGDRVTGACQTKDFVWLSPPHGPGGLRQRRDPVAEEGGPRLASRRCRSAGAGR
nr:SDR family oxidoreductase [Streptomyces sp. SBT349]